MVQQTPRPYTSNFPPIQSMADGGNESANVELTSILSKGIASGKNQQKGLGKPLAVNFGQLVPKANGEVLGNIGRFQLDIYITLNMEYLIITNKVSFNAYKCNEHMMDICTKTFET